jgi:hypothetical protein
MPGVNRPWFEYPACLQKCRYVYLRATIACARCHSLQNASRHLRRQTPGVGRAERLGRKLGDYELRRFAPLPTRRRRPKRRRRIACPFLALAVVMPRPLSSSAAACVDRCAVPVTTGLTAAGRDRRGVRHAHDGDRPDFALGKVYTDLQYCDRAFERLLAGDAKATAPDAATIRRSARSSS